jgi:uncharacterized protein (UPF0333 family)
VVRGSVRKTVERAKSVNYKTVAENFSKGAEVAREYEYWNAAGVLVIHAAIAYADAISIKVGSVKSQGEDHHDTIALLEDLVAASESKKKALNHLRTIIDHKTSVSYSGDVYTKSDVDRLWKHMERFQGWALEVLGS